MPCLGRARAIAHQLVINLFHTDNITFYKCCESDLIFVPAVSGLVSEAFWKEYSKMR
jgi:hypothetical protein